MVGFDVVVCMATVERSEGVVGGEKVNTFLMLVWCDEKTDSTNDKVVKFFCCTSVVSCAKIVYCAFVVR